MIQQLLSIDGIPVYLDTDESRPEGCVSLKEADKLRNQGKHVEGIVLTSREHDHIVSVVGIKKPEPFKVTVEW